MSRSRARWAGIAVVLANACGGSAAGPVVATAPASSSGVLPPPVVAAPKKVTPARPALPPPAGDVGTAHPVVVQAVGANAQWAALCQARADTDGDGKIEIHVGYHGDLHGDEMTPFLVLGSGAGAPIDDFVTASPSGRHLVVIRQGKLVLIDSESKGEVDLSAHGADVRDDHSPFGHHRAAELSDDGERVLYLRHDAAGDSVVVRELATQNEVVIPAGPGMLWRATFAPGGRWVQLLVVAKDTDGDGKLTWPTPRTSLGGRKCRGPIAVYGVYGRNGDEPEERYARVTGGAAVTAADVVIPMGDALIRRAKDGALSIDAGGGKTRALAPAACGAKVLAVDPPSGRVLVACGALAKKHKTSYGEEELAPASIFGGPAEVKLGATIDVSSFRRESPSIDAVTLLRDGTSDGRVRVEVATGRQQKLPKDGVLLGFDDPARIVMHHEGRVFSFDVADPTKTTTLATGAKDVGAVEGTLTVLRDDKGAQSLFDAAGSAPPIPVKGKVVRLAKGAALVAPDADEGRRAIPSGPLRWIAAR
jgi:hypothetical protein